MKTSDDELASLKRAWRDLDEVATTMVAATLHCRKILIDRGDRAPRAIVKSQIAASVQAAREFGLPPLEIADQLKGLVLALEIDDAAAVGLMMPGGEA